MDPMASISNQKITGAQKSPTSVLIAAISVKFDEVAQRRSTLELLVNEHTIQERRFDTNDLEFKLDLTPPYTLQEGSRLTLRLDERKSKLHRKKTVEATMTTEEVQGLILATAGGYTEYEIMHHPTITITLASAAASHSSILKEASEALSGHKSVLDHLGKSRSFLEALLKTGTAFSELHPIAKAVLACVNVVHKHLESLEQCHKVILDLAEDMTRTIGYVEDINQFARLAQLVEAINDIRPLMEDTSNFIVKYSSRNKLTEAVQSVFSSFNKNQIEQIKRRFEVFKQQFDRGVHVQSAISLEIFKMANEDDGVLAELKPEKNQRGSIAKECLEGTRLDILEEITKWMLDLSAPNVLHLKGHPGVGKSAISSSLVAKMRDSKRLGSWFFFQRANAASTTPSSLWRTVAFDLAQKYPTMRRGLVAKLKAHPDIATTGNIQTLFKHLILDPLRAGDDIPVGRLPVIVIDALDECDGLEGARSEHRRDLLDSLKNWGQLPRGFKIIVTSRDEADIEHSLSSISHALGIPAGTTVSLQSSNDIASFFKDQFQGLTQGYPSLGEGWPGPEVIQELASRAGGLFIWANTVIKLIKEGEPKEELQRIMEQKTEVGGIDALYAQILEVGFPRPTSKVVTAFHSIFEAIILATSPLTASSIARLLSIDDTAMEHICGRLKSVLEPRMGPHDVLKISHQSFTDFLLQAKNEFSEIQANFKSQNDGARCDHNLLYPISVQHGHESLSLSCLEILLRDLKDDICDIGTPEEEPPRNFVINNLDRLDRAVRYALDNWVGHTIRGMNKSICDRLLQFFRQKVLNWIEYMYLSSRGYALIQQMSDLQKAVANELNFSGDSSYQQLLQWCNDVPAFLERTSTMIRASVLHIYSSALIFLLPENLIYRHYRHLYKLPTARFLGEQSQSSSKILSGDSGRTRATTLSSDGIHFTTADGDGLLLWKGKSRELVSTMSCDALCTAFSRDGSTLYAVSRTPDIRIHRWEVKTGKSLGTPWNLTNLWVHRLTCSADDTQIACLCSNGWVYRINADDGEIIAKYNYSEGVRISEICFSENKGILTATCNSNGITLRRFTASGQDSPQELLLNKYVTEIAFHPKGHRLASISNGHCILWDVASGEKLWCCSYQHMDSLVYSNDGDQIALAEIGGKAYFLNGETGKSMELTDDIGGFSWPIAYSRTEHFLITSGNQFEIRLINNSILGTEDENNNNTALKHRKNLTAACVSPDGMTLASFDKDGQLCLWEIETGNLTLGPIEIELGQITTATYHPSGRYIAYGIDGGVHFLIPETGTHVGMRIKINWQSNLAFSPDGLLLSVVDSNTITLYKLSEGPFFTATVEMPIQANFRDRTAYLSFNSTSKFIACQTEPDSMTYQGNEEMNGWSILNGAFYKMWAIESSPTQPVMVKAPEEAVTNSFPLPLCYWDCNEDNLSCINIGERFLIVPSGFVIEYFAQDQRIIILGEADGYSLLCHHNKIKLSPLEAEALLTANWFPCV